MTKKQRIKQIIFHEFSTPYSELTYERNKELKPLHARKQELLNNVDMVRQFDKAGNFKPPASEQDELLQTQFKVVKEDISTIWVNYYLHTSLMLDDTSNMIEKRFDITTRLNFLSGELMKLCVLSLFDRNHREYFNKAAERHKAITNSPYDDEPYDFV
jgi:hypothetical protein